MSIPAAVAPVLAAADLESFSLLGRLLLAAVLGGIVGIEREVSGKPAGLRTNLLICLGAALLTELSIGVAVLANEENIATGSPFRADPARIAAQIVSGIGFLGAGTILQARGNVIGLTTAATIWVVAAIGMAVGAQAYIEAIGATVLVLISLAALSRLEYAIIERRGSRRYIVSTRPDPVAWEQIEVLLRSAGLHVEATSLDKSDDRYEIAFRLLGAPARQDAALQQLMSLPDVRRITRADQS
jgi:putative Mg2+ transporter-C (MgtC) family protein